MEESQTLPQQLGDGRLQQPCRYVGMEDSGLPPITRLTDPAGMNPV